MPPVSQAILLNALGQTVRTLALPGSNAEQRLATTGLAAGLYTLQVRQGNDVLTRRVVLEYQGRNAQQKGRAAQWAARPFSYVER